MYLLLKHCSRAKLISSGIKWVLSYWFKCNYSFVVRGKVKKEITLINNRLYWRMFDDDVLNRCRRLRNWIELINQRHGMMENAESQDTEFLKCEIKKNNRCGKFPCFVENLEDIFQFFGELLKSFHDLIKGDKATVYFCSVFL